MGGYVLFQYTHTPMYYKWIFVYCLSIFQKIKNFCYSNKLLYLTFHDTDLYFFKNKK